MSEKYIVDGKVAVLYSPRFGVGWSTWAHGDRQRIEKMIFDPDLVKLVLSGASGREVGEYTAITYDSPVHGPLAVEWVPVGERFVITEYDGFETVVTSAGFDWITA